MKDRLVGDERGTVTAFVTVMTLAMLMATGLVLDGGNLLAARREAVDRAAAAARAGAQAVDTDALRRRERRIDPGAAVRAAEDHLRGNGLHGDVRVEDDRIRVTVMLRRELTLLTLVGLNSASVSGTGQARLVRGITGAET